MRSAAGPQPTRLVGAGLALPPFCTTDKLHGQGKPSPYETRNVFGKTKQVARPPASWERRKMVHQKQFSLRTTGQGDMHDITHEVAAAVTASNIQAGTVNVFNIGSTAAIGTIEFEPGLQQDLPAILNKLIPPSRSYGHEQAWHDGNGHSHLQATLLGPSLTVPIAEGKLVLGTWQQIFHLECDVRGRQRTVMVTVMGDK